MIEIIKHGKTHKALKFICPDCGCEFIMDNAYPSLREGERVRNLMINCPDCGAEIDYSDRIYTHVWERNNILGEAFNDPTTV